MTEPSEMELDAQSHSYNNNHVKVEETTLSIHINQSEVNAANLTQSNSNDEPASAPPAKRSQSRKTGGSRARAKSTSRTKPSSSRSKSRHKRSSQSNNHTSRNQAVEPEQSVSSDNDDDNDAEMADEEYIGRPSNLSAREMEQEKQALAYRLLLKRPEFITRRRQQQAEARSQVDTQVARWPYIDTRNVDLWNSEQDVRRSSSSSSQSSSSLIQSSDIVQSHSEIQSNGSNGVSRDSASQDLPDLPKANDTVSPISAHEAAGDADLTESDDDAPITSARAHLPPPSRPSAISRIPRVDDKHRKARQAMIQQTSSQCPSYPEDVLSSQTEDPFGLVSVESNLARPELTIGTRCHIFDKVTNRHRDGHIAAFNRIRGYQIRLDPIASDSTSRAKDSSLQRWIQLHEEQSFWEVTDVAWARNPDLKSKQKFWPCQVVQLYKFGVRSYSIADTSSNQRTAPDYVLVHLLGYLEDYELHEIPTRLVFPFLHGLQHSWGTRSQHKAVQSALEVARWLYHFHCSRWLKLENDRRRVASQKLCSFFQREGPGPFIGKRVSCLWKEDSMWYAGVITQFNALTQSFCVVYDDREMEWVSFARNVFTLDSFALPVTVDLDEEQPYPHVDICYFDFRLYADNAPSISDPRAWLNRMDAIRKYQAETAYSQTHAPVPAVMPDPVMGQQGHECWECGLVDDVFLLSAMRGVEKNRSDNISCLRCRKICHPRCYALMRDRLEHGKHNDNAHADDHMLDVEVGNHRRADADEGGQRWTIVIDKSKPPRCVDCLKCEHCHLFGAKATRPQIIQDTASSDSNNTGGVDGNELGLSTSETASSQQIQSNPPKEVYPTLRAPTDLLTCDVCNIRVHRQCLEPPFSETIPKLVGGWVCRACLACRSCLTTQAQFEHDLANPGVVASSSISRLFARDHLTEEVDSADETVKTRDKVKSVTKTNRGSNRRVMKTESEASDPLASIIQALEDDDDDVEDEHQASESLAASDGLAEVDQSCISTPPAGQIPSGIISQLVRDVLTNIICNITEPVSHDHDESATMSDQSQLRHSVLEPETDPPQHFDQSKQVSLPFDVPQSSLTMLASITSPSKRQAPSSKSQNPTIVSPLPAEPVLLLGTDSRFWELWKHEFTMCNGCADRMTAREYCVICCALWDDLPMVQCARCVRWIHIECDKNARSTDDETLAKDSVVYHCPDCVSRERANEMIAILDVLNTQDRNHYFLNPVTAEDAPEYSDTIKTPMDFTTIYNKLYSMSYKTIEQFKYDLNLVWRNAKDYNPSSSIVYKTAVRLQQKSVELLDVLRIKNGDAELEHSEGRIEDKEPDREHASSHPSPSATASSARSATISDASLHPVPESPPETPINVDQSQREHLMVTAIQPFRFFHPPDSLGELLMHIDICTVCGAAGDHEHFLACSDCGDMFHWFCLDIDMLRRAYRDPSQTGGPQVAIEDFDSINSERLTGHWKCHNCAVCNICSSATRLRTLETKQVQRRNDRDREREEFGEEQTTSYTVQVVSETVVQQPIVDCDICDRTFHVKCLGPNFELPPSLGPDYPPPPYRCAQCVYCLFCGTTRPGKKSTDEWQLGYTACSPCARLWREGKCCPVCQKLWRKEGSSTSSTNHSSIKSELDSSLNVYDRANEENDSMQCEMCRKWTHLTCDPVISRAQYELLGDASFEYFCPTCRAASHELDQDFREQLGALRDMQEQMEKKQRLAMELMITKQDVSSIFYAPFPKGADAVARFAPLPQSAQTSPERITTNIINTIFRESADAGMLNRLSKLSQRQIMEQTKKFVHRTQTLRRRERRKWLVQQKRAARENLPLAQRCAPWLDDADDSSSLDHDTLALIDKLLKELLIVYNRQPTQSRFLLPRILAAMDPYEPRPVSPGPFVELPHSHISMESQPNHVSSEQSPHQQSSKQPPKLEVVLSNGIKSEGSIIHANGVSLPHDNGVHDMHIDQQVSRHEHTSANHATQQHSTSSIKHEPGMLIPVPPRNRHVASPLQVAGFTFTFEGQHATDPRVCFLCNKHGDQEEHLDSSGRLLPADPFKSAFSYAHVHCALWASSMHGSTSEQGEMTGVFTAYVKHCRQQCDHCGEFMASIGCRFSKCKKLYHFDCAIAADCIFTADTKVYCAEHASRTKGLVEHNLVPVQRAMFIKTSTYDVTDGKLKMKPSAELRSGLLLSGEGRSKAKVHYKRKKTKTSTWQEKKAIKKQKVSSPTAEQFASTEDPTPEAELEEGEIDARGSLEEGEIDPDDDDESKSEHAESVTVKNEIENTSSPSLEHPANQITISPTLYHQRLGALTIISLGSVNPSPGFHSSHFMYPIGFHAYRLFWSYVHKYRRVGYHLYIESQNDRPLFRIVADDDTDHPIESNEPAAAVTLLVKRLRGTFGSSYRTTSPMISAPWLFGYGLPPVVEQLEYREGSDMLSLPEYEFGYNSRRMEVRKSDLADIETERLMHLADERAIQAAMAVEVPSNPTGCARLEPYAGKRPWSSKVNYKAGFGFNSALLTGAGPAAVSFSSSNLAATVELASDKRRKVGQVEASAAHLSANAMSAAALTHAYRAMKTSVTPRAVVGHSVIHEWGLFAACHLEANTMVVEYLGESIRQKVADMREKRYEETGIGSCYMFRIDSDMIIDATKRGNIGRFINHSCDPNCVTRIIDVNGVKKIAVITNRRVGLGEEITYDYFFANEADRIACNCGARNCAGRLN